MLIFMKVNHLVQLWAAAPVGKVVRPPCRLASVSALTVFALFARRNEILLYIT